ncbi:MAG: zinc-binding dehydrogenase [Bacteroidetes bacterium]|nr:zinc-binding dehydrogenase [Bacteroidota bacterium]
MKRQIYQLKAGSINNLERLEDQLPDPEDTEVQIEVKAIGLNFADVFAIWGLYSATPKGIFTPGLEYAGVVIKCGKDVNKVKEGDRVMGVTRFGAYASHLNIDARYVVRLPANWDFREGAAYVVQGLTAYYALFNLGALQKGDTVLIHSAAGGVGTLANRMAKYFDAYTIGSVGGAAKVEYCKKEGYDKVIVRGEDFGAQLEENLGGRPLHLVMECIGGKVLKAGYDQLAPRGRMVVYGSASYSQKRDKPNPIKLILKYLRRPKIDPQGMIQENKGILGFNLIYLYEEADLMHEILGEIADMDIGKPNIGAAFAFDDLPDAIRTFSKGKTTGKVVITL